MGDEVVVSVKLICDIAEGNPIYYPYGNRLLPVVPMDFFTLTESPQSQLPSGSNPTEFGSVVAEIFTNL